MNKNNLLIFIINIISLIVIIIVTLIFNELLIINTFASNQNMKKGFIKKEMLELQIITSLGNHEDNEDRIDSKKETLNENDKK